MKLPRFQFTIRKLLCLTLIVALCLPFYGRVVYYQTRRANIQWAVFIIPRWKHLSGLSHVSLVRDRRPNQLYLAFYLHDFKCNRIADGVPYALAWNQKGDVIWQSPGPHQRVIWKGTAEKPQN